MKAAKLDELIADLGYALMHLKQARANSTGGDSDINRARELTSKVGDALIAERKKMPAAMKGRTWTDVRRLDCVALADGNSAFIALDRDDLHTLYDIVVAEHENWDGEEVSNVQIVKLMIARYQDVGLTPSRN